MFDNIENNGRPGRSPLQAAISDLHNMILFPRKKKIKKMKKKFVFLSTQYYFSINKPEKPVFWA